MANVTKSYLKEKLLLTYLLTAVFLLILTDISMAFSEGLPIGDIAVDITLKGTILILVLFTTNFVWKKFTIEKASKESIENDLENTKQLARLWERKSKEFILEFQDHVAHKFQEWSLSKSEKEIALLILQGKSSKEMSALRFTSERTIRNQCRSIYEKSGLGGKGELSAFFLNDLISDFPI